MSGVKARVETLIRFRDDRLDEIARDGTADDDVRARIGPYS